jgi:hypothetical protein
VIRPKRKERLSEFPPAKNYPSVLLLFGVFGCGLAISFYWNVAGAAAYLGLWGISYLVIYAGTCRYCVYYGKRCPIPLEGSCVHRFFEKKETGFGWLPLFWATLVYGLRVLVPVVIIFRYRLILSGTVYFFLLALFWIVHLRFTGCPNCANTGCPLNPDYGNADRLIQN